MRFKRSSDTIDNAKAERTLDTLLEAKKDELVVFKRSYVPFGWDGRVIDFHVAPIEPVNAQNVHELNLILASLRPPTLRLDGRRGFSIFEQEAEPLINDKDLADVFKSVKRSLVFGRLMFADRTKRLVVNVFLYTDENLAKKAYETSQTTPLVVDMEAMLEVKSVEE